MVAVFGAGIPLASWPKLRRVDGPVLGIGILLFAMLTPFTIIYVLKNLDFFGGGLVGLSNMTRHGAALLVKKFGSNGLLAIGLMAVPAALALLQFLVRTRINLRRRSGFTPLHVPIAGSLTLGMFGYTTLAVCIPALITLLYVLSWRRLASLAQSALVPAAA